MRLAVVGKNLHVFFELEELLLDIANPVPLGIAYVNLARQGQQFERERQWILHRPLQRAGKRRPQQPARFVAPAQTRDGRAL